LFNEGRDAYLDFPGSPRRPGCRFERDARRFRAGRPHVTYAHIVWQKGSQEFALQYWFFFYFNDWTNNHEGDWEMIQLAFRASSVKEALRKEPIRVTYAQHNGGEVRSWDDKDLRREGSHPVVFLSAGSHASHFQPNLYIGRGENRSGFGCDDSAGASRRLEMETVLVPHEPASAADPFAWLGFRGHWGEISGHEFDGPKGPIRLWQWWGPFDWEADHVRDFSIHAPGLDAIGPNAVQVFCQAIALGSDLFVPLVIELPVVSAFVAGVVCLGAVSTITRTRYMPVRIHPLRHRRRLGQVLVSAFAIYRRKIVFFLAMGILFLPVSFFIPAAQWRPEEVSLFEPLVDEPLAAIGQRIALIFALGELQLGLIYAVIAATATAALASMEGSGHMNLGNALAMLWRRLPDLVLPRLAAIAIVTALAFTIVGIPLAITLAIRWAFIEQAVLLDGKTGKEAMAESSRIVAGHWWWSAGAIAALGVLALGVAPALGVLLILTVQSAPLLYINLFSAIVHACIVPYFAIALALTYYDLKSR
jgi:hypothetical protein